MFIDLFVDFLNSVFIYLFIYSFMYLLICVCIYIFIYIYTYVGVGVFCPLAPSRDLTRVVGAGAPGPCSWSLRWQAVWVGEVAKGAGEGPCSTRRLLGARLGKW